MQETSCTIDSATHWYNHLCKYRTGAVFMLELSKGNQRATAHIWLLSTLWCFAIDRILLLEENLPQQVLISASNRSWIGVGHRQDAPCVTRCRAMPEKIAHQGKAEKISWTEISTSKLCNRAYLIDILILAFCEQVVQKKLYLFSKQK